ncbi:MAG TPA: hypothetical protein VGL10_05400, partial [Gammaproteobacteria bacterium]
LFFALAVAAPAFAGLQTPELPRIKVDTVYVPPRGKILTVRREQSFQAALNSAAPGDVIMLEAGAVFTGPFSLPEKPGAEWIIIRSSIADDRLPPPGRRIDPSYADRMPKLTARANTPVLTTAPGAHHYRFIGIEIRPEGSSASPYSNQTLVQLGSNENKAERLPHHLIFDRCYLHGGAGGARRGIALNSRDTAVIDSYLSDFKTVGEDSQALAGWNGPGPFRIANNYLEGAGENVMFGGGTPSIAGLVPSDIELHGNHFAKPLSWKIGAPDYAGTPWTVKNLFELKNARRVHVAGNLLEHSWPHGQDGYAILFTVRTEDDAVPWAVVEDIVFENNVVRRSAAGVNIMGIDNSRHGNGRSRRIAIKNNLFDEIGWSGNGRLFQMLDGTEHVSITHNTAFHSDTIIFGERTPHRGFVFTDNILPHNAYGIAGGGVGTGQPTLERYFPGAVVQRNVIVGGPAGAYPRGNFFPRSFADVGFVNPAIGDYRLKSGSPYAGKDPAGKDIGVDFTVLRPVLELNRTPSQQNAPKE